MSKIKTAEWGFTVVELLVMLVVLVIVFTTFASSLALSKQLTKSFGHQYC